MIVIVVIIGSIIRRGKNSGCVMGFFPVLLPKLLPRSPAVVAMYRKVEVRWQFCGKRS